MLMIFTSSYPFGNMNDFMENEIEHLAARFPSICIVPARVGNMAHPTPENVEVDVSLARARSDRAVLIARAVSSAMGRKLLRREFATNARHLRRPNAMRRALVSLGHAVATYQWLFTRAANRVALAREGASDRWICYTYWFGGETLGVGLCRQRFPELCVRVVTRAHGGDVFEHRYTPDYIPFRKQALPQVDKVFSVSSAGQRYLRGRYPEYQAKFAVARLGVPDRGIYTRSSTDGCLRVVSCSTMVPVKRIALLIDGLRALALRHPRQPIEWVHLGDGPLRAQHEAHARSQLPPNVSWNMRGALDNAGVMEHYRTQEVDVFINVSASEGIPVAVMEAYSCGIPAIATAVGGLPEIVNDNNGLLIDSNPSPDKIADALAVFLQPAPDKRAASKRTWRALYDAATNYGEFASRLQENWCHDRHR